MNQLVEKNRNIGPGGEGSVWAMECLKCGHKDLEDNFISFQPDGYYCPQCGSGYKKELVTESDIEDIVVLVRMKGKLHPIIHKSNISSEMSKDIRIKTFSICLSDFHDISELSVDELKSMLEKEVQP